MDQLSSLRTQLASALCWQDAHVDFDRAIADLPERSRGARPAHSPHTAWRLVEHMRIAQWDILEFCRNQRHVSPAFPDGYWPDGDAPPNIQAWDAAVTAFRDDLEAMCALITNPGTDLFAPIPHGQGQTILREAILLIDHYAYHVGQLVAVRRSLGIWRD